LKNHLNGFDIIKLLNGNDDIKLINVNNNTMSIINYNGSNNILYNKYSFKEAIKSINNAINLKKKTIQMKQIKT